MTHMLKEHVYSAERQLFKTTFGSRFPHPVNYLFTLGEEGGGEQKKNKKKNLGFDVLGGGAIFYLRGGTFA